MSQIGSTFVVADNTGVKTIIWIGLIFSKAHQIKLGNWIIGVITQSVNKTLKKSNIVKAIVIRLKKTTKFETGLNITFADNAVVLVDHNLNPLGSRILGPLPWILKKNNYLKLISISSEFI
uniref:50S ribosomal protein L14 n=1 Tax=Nephromyces sp. ex Molgula occidentalis TaxID=2544991 RepID=A0A5C1H9Q3_9APIC|nr:50S ribosomal protein L14 [Nephromyces sp. ex Molgula occidentalis]